MSHRCGGHSCYRTLGLRNECPPCNLSRKRAARNRRMNRKFERLPKSRYWRRSASYQHLWKFGLTPVIIAETLEAPTEVEFQTSGTHPRKALYKFLPQGFLGND